MEQIDDFDSKMFPQGKKLGKMKGVTSVFEGAKQIQVLTQTDDGTVYGHQSCGYHALKNAMILIYANDLVIPRVLETMFSDKSLFSVFDKKYIQPLLLGRTSGKYDASSPVIRQIIHNFIEDPNPPKELKQLQQSLKNRGDCLAVFNMSTTTGDQSGVPLFGLFDEEGLKDAVKFFNFAKRKGEGSFTAIFGNEIMGHWFTINIFREKNGKITYYCCDSLGEKHDITGLYSPFGKMVTLLQHDLSQPEEFLRKSFEGIGEELYVKAGWISHSGETSGEHKKMLMDETPNDLLAIPGVSNGSLRDQLIHKCLSSFKMMENCGWLESSNIEQQNHVNNLLKLLKFFSKNLDSNSSYMPYIEEALKTIEQKQNHNHINQAFKEALEDFESLKNPMMLSKSELAQTTFQQVFSVFQRKSELSNLNSEHERLSEINKFTNSAGAEPGFSSGKTPNEVENEITRKMQTALIAYQKAKQKGLLKEFIEAISNGDRCLTARFGRIEDFMASKLMGFDLEEETRKDQIFMLSDTAISTALWEIAPEGVCNSITPDTLLESEEHIKALASSFKQFGSAETAKPFRKFLEKEGLVSSVDEINWEEIMPSLVKAPFFLECLARGKQLFVSQY